MTDDWSSPTGEHDPAHIEPAKLRNRGPTPVEHDDEIGEIDPALGVTAGELRMVDAFFHELALEVAADPRPPTPAEQIAIDNLRARFERLKAMSPEEESVERERLVRLDR